MKKRVGVHPLRENSRIRSNTRNIMHSLFSEGMVKTSMAQAKQVRGLVERLITIARGSDKVSAVRMVQKRAGNSETARLIMEYAQLNVARTSGFLSIKKHSVQRGDNKIVVAFSLLDFVKKAKKAKLDKKASVEKVEEKSADEKKESVKKVAPKKTTKAKAK